MEKENKNIWVTGASSGIGRAISVAFANAGQNVFATARSKENLDELKQQASLKVEINTDVVDVTSKENVFSFAGKMFGGKGIACLINNAGVTSFNKIEQNSLEEIEKIIQTNLLGAIYTTKAILPVMLKQKKGTIINILSVVTEKIFQQSGVYSASKAGLKAFSQVLREEVRESNIRIINVYPAATDTKIWPSGVSAKFSHRMMKPENLAEMILSIYQTKENIVAEEVVLRPIEGDL